MSLDKTVDEVEPEDLLHQVLPDFPDISGILPTLSKSDQESLIVIRKLYIQIQRYQAGLHPDCDIRKYRL